MRGRLSVVLLAMVAAGAFAVESTLRSAAVIVVVSVLFLATLARPSRRLIEVAVTTAVALSCLAPFVYAIAATSAVLVILAVNVRQDVAPLGGLDVGRLGGLARSVPAMAIVVALIVTIAIGDRRVESTPELTSDPIDRNLTIGIDDSRIAIDLIQSSQSEYLLESQLEYTNDALWDTSSRVSRLDGGDGSKGPGLSDQVPWLLALIALLVGAYTLFASRRFSVHSKVMADGPTVAAPSPLDWYDRIVAATGHPRDPPDPVLSHSRRTAIETGDERVRQLGRIVSDHLYSGRALSDDDLELIRSLGTAE